MSELDIRNADTIDAGCYLCGDALPIPPEGVPANHFNYIVGFADGVHTAMRGEGYVMCENHKKLIRAALLEKGINWGRPDRK